MTIEIHFLLCVGTEEMDDIHSLLLSMHLIVLYIIDTDGLQAIRTYYYTTYVYGSVVHFCTWAKCIGESCSGTSESQQEEVSPYGSSYKLKGRRGMLLPFSSSSFLFFPSSSFFDYYSHQIENVPCQREKRGRDLYSLLLRIFRFPPLELLIIIRLAVLFFLAATQQPRRKEFLLRQWSHRRHFQFSFHFKMVKDILYLPTEYL